MLDVFQVDVLMQASKHIPLCGNKNDNSMKNK